MSCVQRRRYEGFGEPAASSDAPAAKEPRCDEHERRGVRREDQPRRAACDERAIERARPVVRDLVGLDAQR